MAGWMRLSWAAECAIAHTKSRVGATGCETVHRRVAARRRRQVREDDSNPGGESALASSLASRVGSIHCRRVRQWIYGASSVHLQSSRLLCSG